MERAQAATRTHSALLHRAQTGAAVSGPCFGYVNSCTACTTPTTLRPCGCKALKRRVVVEAEAAVVREIFRRASRRPRGQADRASPEQRAALAPRSAGHWRAGPHRACAGYFTNQIYVGRVVWNQSKKRDVWGQRNPSARDAAEVVIVSGPRRRALSTTPCGTPRTRSSRQDVDSTREVRGGLWGGRPSGSVSRFLLTGLGAAAAAAAA